MTNVYYLCVTGHLPPLASFVLSLRYDLYFIIVIFVYVIKRRYEAAIVYLLLDSFKVNFPDHPSQSITIGAARAGYGNLFSFYLFHC